MIATLLGMRDGRVYVDSGDSFAYICGILDLDILRAYRVDLVGHIKLLAHSHLILRYLLQKILFHTRQDKSKNLFSFPFSSIIPNTLIIPRKITAAR